MKLFVIITWLVSIINLFALWVISQNYRVETGTGPEHAEDPEHPVFTPWQVTVMITVALVIPVLNLLFVARSIKILRKPAKTLWKNIRVKISIWRH
jgi:hypothetical protein